jgi:F420-non-reducing hydrogenase iron-sulfur subunit
MCSGRVDPVMIAESFISGADGVFIGACLSGECHYTSGNFHAMGKILMVQKLLSHAGINPDRLVMKMMSSAEGAKFVSFITEFQNQIRELGKIGSSEGIPENELEIKLLAAKAAVAGKKLRWVAGKRLEFLEKGNLYGEIFTEHEIHRMFEEVVLDELTIQEILLRAKEKPLTINKLSDVLHQPTKRVLRQLVDMRKMGLVKITGVEKNSPLWLAC